MHALNICPSLNNPRGGLDETKNHREYQNERCHPERILLGSLSVVVPPLRDRSRLRIIERLLENYQAVSSILKLLI
jgi:hypothetical protein